MHLPTASTNPPYSRRTRENLIFCCYSATFFFAAKRRSEGAFLMRALERLIGSLKQQPDYRLSSSYSVRQLFTILLWRGLQVMRGLRFRFFLAKSSSPLFCGRGVRIEHAAMVRAGRSLILEDFVFINALSRKGITLGRNVTIARGTIISCTGVIARCGDGVSIGDRSAIGAQSFLGGQGGIEIGTDVIMGPGVRIFSENHVFADISMPIRLQGEERARVTIENDCWIGAGATILAGVTIGCGTVVAAGAVVTKSHPRGSILGGVPARVIGSREGS